MRTNIFCILHVYCFVSLWMQGPWVLWILNETSKADQLCFWSVTVLHKTKSSKPASSKGESWVLQSVLGGLLLISQIIVHFFWCLDVDIHVGKSEDSEELDLTREEKLLRNEWNEKKDFLMQKWEEGLMFLLLIKCNPHCVISCPMKGNGKMQVKWVKL